MVLDVSIKTDDSGVYRLLRQIEKRLGNLKPAMSLIGEIVHGSIQQNFEEGGRPRRWRPLSPVTIAQRRRLGKWPGRILVRSGVAGGLMGGISYRPYKDRVELSANKVYAATHQLGARRGQFGRVAATVREHIRRMKDGRTVKVKAHTRRMLVPWGDIPARPFMAVQTEDWDEIRESMLDYLVLLKR